MRPKRALITLLLLGFAAMGLMAPSFAHGADPALAPEPSTDVDGGPYGVLGGVVNFESLNLAPGSQIDLPPGQAQTVDGFTFTPGPNDDSGFNDSHYGNAVTFWGYNGTHVATHHDDVVMTKDGGGTFNLLSFDFSGFPIGAEVPFTVTGQPGNVIQAFNPDGIVDGEGGAVDFQTFILPGTFQNLTSVTWEHFGPATIGGLFSLDNIVLGGATPVESGTWGGIKKHYR